MITLPAIHTKEEDIKKLKTLARKAKSSRMRLRYDVIRLNLQGRSISQIAEIFDITRGTVKNYIKSYNDSGVKGLDMKSPPGRTKKLNDSQEQQLFVCISTKLPKDVGFEPFVNWTAPLACNWVYNNFGVSFSERGMRDVFYRMELSYTRPTYSLKKADPEKQSAFKDEFESIKKN